MTSCENLIPHLLSDDNILSALRQMHVCLRPGGGCLIIARDCDREEPGKGIVKPHDALEGENKRCLCFQV